MLHRIVRPLAAAVALVLLAMAPLPALAQTVIVRDGQPAASIVLPAEPTKAEQLAADELQSHLELMSGATLPIVKAAGEASGVPIFIGTAAPSAELERIREHNPEPAAFRLHVTPEQIQLVGLGDEGVTIAVYELLEQQGVRWLIPAEIGLDVPAKKTVTVKQQDLIDGPGFGGRTLQAIGDAAWARRNRLGGWNAGGHGLGPKFDRKERPELFYQENGKPTVQEKVSHPEVLRAVIEHWRAYLKKNPDAKYIPVGPHDGQGFGEDPWDADDFDPILGRRATTDRYVKFFNLILEDLQKDYPEVGLAFYAYTQEMRPPVREKPNPKILPMLAAIGLDRFHSIHNPLSWEKQYLKTVVEGWQKLGVNMSFRGYLFNLADHGLPFSMIDIVRDEWPYYYDKGFIMMRVECIVNWAYHAPALYLAAKLFWEPHADADALLQEWFTRMYGPAAEAMTEHFDIIENAYIHGDYYTGNVYDVPKILTPEVRKEMGRTLAEAEKLVAGTEGKFADRVKLVRLGYDYGESNFKMMDAFFNGDYEEAKKHKDHIQDEQIPVLVAHDPPVISPRTHVGYFKRFWANNVEEAYDRVAGKGRKVLDLPDEWLFMLDPYGSGEDLFLFQPGIGTQPWEPIKTRSATASNQGLRYYKWTGWYRTSVDVPEQPEGAKLHLWFGGLDDTARVWINGKEVPQSKRGAAPIGRGYEFDATGALVPGEENLIVVKVSDTSVNELGTFGINGPAMIWAETGE